METICVTVTPSVHAALESIAHTVGLTLESYVAALLSSAAEKYTKIE